MRVIIHIFHALSMHCPHTVHALSMNTTGTRRLHAVYLHVGAAIPLTGAVHRLSAMFQKQFHKVSYIILLTF